MNLTDRERERLKRLIDAGKPLPPKYKLLLFEDAPEVELIWQGKTSEVTSVVLPFQSIEQIDEPRAEAGKTIDLFSVDATGRQSGGWTNKLIWADNKLVLSSLRNGPLRREIEDAGGLKLIYIDPPFDVGADFSFDVEVGDETLVKQPSVIEEVAYRDTWGRGMDSYLTMLYERLSLMHALLAPDGAIYVHVDYRVCAHVRVLLDELFGASFFHSEIIWQKVRSIKWQSSYFGNIHDTILFFGKSEQSPFTPQFRAKEENILTTHYRYVEEETGRKYRLSDFTQNGNGPPRSFAGKVIAPPPGKHWIWSQERIDQAMDSGRLVFSESGTPYLKRYLDEVSEDRVPDMWDDIYPVNPMALERQNYPTQKPEALLERILKASSNEGDLVADFFCGSGTTLAVAEKLGRKWIGCDLGRFAIHTSRKRLIDVQRQLKDKGKPYRSFEILNLGKYERQYFVGIDPTLPEDQKRAQTIQREEHYVTLILSAYKAERAFQIPPFHGRKGSTAVVVGPIDAPVTLEHVNEIVAACREHQISKVDILGFEFEMSLTPKTQDEARQKGVGLSLRYIPRDVFDRRAVEKGQVEFYDVAYVELQPKVQKLAATITLKDFGVFYRQDNTDTVGEKLKAGGSKVTVENGQVVKVQKSKKGRVTREVLTKEWTDWIDYWAVDFDFENRKEIIRLVEDGEEKEVWTGSYIFENEWQSFRTRKDRSLELTSAKHTYPSKGKHKIAVKVIDIFGNDTTKVIEAKV